MCLNMDTLDLLRNCSWVIAIAHFILCQKYPSKIDFLLFYNCAKVRFELVFLCILQSRDRLCNLLRRISYWRYLRLPELSVDLIVNP